MDTARINFTFIYGFSFYIQTAMFETQLLLFSMYTIDIFATLIKLFVPKIKGNVDGGVSAGQSSMLSEQQYDTEPDTGGRRRESLLSPPTPGTFQE